MTDTLALADSNVTTGAVVFLCSLFVRVWFSVRRWVRRPAEHGHSCATGAFVTKTPGVYLPLTCVCVCVCVCVCACVHVCACVCDGGVCMCVRACVRA